MNYRAYEDHHGLLKHFGSIDIEFEVIVAGLSSLKGSEKWGQKAKELERKFLTAFDGLFVVEPKETENTTALLKTYLDGIRTDGNFISVDLLSFRKTHDECVRFFKEVSETLALLVMDDRRG